MGVTPEDRTEDSCREISEDPDRLLRDRSLLLC
jgi:hypothetical protein